MPRGLGSYVVMALLVGGCSSDAVRPPDVAVETPGAFVATNSDGKYGLFRSLGIVSYFGENLLITIVYDVHPSSWDDAREVSKRTDLPLPARVTYVAESRLPPHQAVWFRTLTDPEQAVAPK